MEVTALGMIETIGLVSSIVAADAGLKAADVRLLGTDYVRGGLVMVRFEGDVAAVQSAVDAGVGAAQRVGRVFAAHVIPRAMPEVFCMLASDVNEGPGRLHSGGCAQCGGCEGGRREGEAMKETEHEHPKEAAGEAEQKSTEQKRSITNKKNALPLEHEDYTRWKVVKLRQYVRRLPGFPLTANEIRYANKQLLLEALAQWKHGEE